MATGTVHDRYMAGMDQSSPKHRGVAVWFDQHKSTTFRDASGELIFENGRPYHSIVETKTKMPVGPVMPLGWEAPVDVPQQYIIRAIGKVTNLPRAAGNILSTVVTDRIRIDYAQMKADDTRAITEHWRDAVKVASARDWPVPKFRAAMDHRLIAIIGPAPRDPRIAEALMAGNPWALGMKMPTRDPVTGQMRVEEDEELARLILLNRSDVMTPEQAEREDEAQQARAEVQSPDVLAESRAVLAEVNAKLAELKAMQAGTARSDAPKKSHHKKPSLTASTP